ncbi:uncharacterized protein LOC144340243 [Macaca mulatta]
MDAEKLNGFLSHGSGVWTGSFVVSGDRGDFSSQCGQAPLGARDEGGRRLSQRLRPRAETSPSTGLANIGLPGSPRSGPHCHRRGDGGQPSAWGSLRGSPSVWRRLALKFCRGGLAAKLSAPAGRAADSCSNGDIDVSGIYAAGRQPFTFLTVKHFTEKTQRDQITIRVSPSSCRAAAARRAGGHRASSQLAGGGWEGRARAHLITWCTEGQRTARAALGQTTTPRLIWQMNVPLGTAWPECLRLVSRCCFSSGCPGISCTLSTSQQPPDPDPPARDLGRCGVGLRLPGQSEALAASPGWLSCSSLQTPVWP